MRTKRFNRRSSLRSESGQVMLFTVLGLGLFMIGAMAFAIDLSNLWFNRQAAQTAADAACTAGAMDLLVDATNGTTTQGHFGNSSTAAVNFDCNTSNPNTATTNPSPCVYAALNGFPSSIDQTNANSGNLGDNVFVDFPGTVPGITTPPTTIAPTAFMRVTVTNNMPTFFAGMLGRTQQAVRAIAVCGVTQSAAPIPILVLDPNSPKSTPPQAALNIQGNGTIAIFGGPQRSIQANSAASSGSCGQSNCTLNSPWGSAQIDLSHGGPLGTGSDIGVTGAPTAPLGGFVPGTGHWIAPAAPIMDPFAQVCFPGQTSNCNATINGFARPSIPTGPPGGAIPSDVSALGVGCNSFTPVSGKGIQNGKCQVPYKFHGCPDTAGCTLYLAGPYPSGIGVGPGASGVTAIFDPGLYYVTGGLALNSGSEVRNGTGTGDGSGGVTFYFAGSGTVSVAANSGSRTLDPFNTLTGPVDGTGTQYPAPVGGSSLASGVKCLSGSVVPSNLQGGGAGVGLNGNVLLGPCTGYYGDPLGASEPVSIGEQRWFLFFQDRSAIGVQPSWGGGGQFLLAGTMYFHSCNSSGSGVSCTPPPVPATNSSYYQDIFSLQGNSGAGTYVLGEIVADNLTLGGTSGINMDLNPTSAFNILKASLYQ